MIILHYYRQQKNCWLEQDLNSHLQSLDYLVIGNRVCSFNQSMTWISVIVWNIDC